MRVHIYSMNDNITVFDFSGIYNEESFYQNDKSSPFCIINCRDIPGTNCMCDDEAIAHIKKRISEKAFESLQLLSKKISNELVVPTINFDKFLYSEIFKFKTTIFPFSNTS